MGGRSSGWACYNEGGISKAEGSGVCTNCLERKGSPVGSQHLIIVLEKSGAGRGCEDLNSQQWPENDCGKPLGSLK